MMLQKSSLKCWVKCRVESRCFRCTSMQVHVMPHPSTPLQCRSCPSPLCSAQLQQVIASTHVMPFANINAFYKVHSPVRVFIQTPINT